MSFLVMQGISKRYGAAVALNGIDLGMPGGSRTAIVGPSGSDKTTALDAGRRDTKRKAVADVLSRTGVTSLLVTHDQTKACPLPIRWRCCAPVAWLRSERRRGST